MNKIIGYGWFAVLVTSTVLLPLSIVYGFRDPLGYACFMLSSAYFVFRDTLNKLQVVGPLYWISRDNTPKNVSVVSVGFMRELESPWRYGKGIQFTVKNRSFQVGFCKPRYYKNPIEGQLAAMGGRMMEATPEEIGNW